MRVGLLGGIATTHRIWAIDEYAMILRVCVWFSPPCAPIRTERVVVIVKLVLSSS